MARVLEMAYLGRLVLARSALLIIEGNPPSKNDEPIYRSSHVLRHSSPFIWTAQMDNRETVIATRNHCFISHLVFRETSFSTTEFPLRTPFARFHRLVQSSELRYATRGASDQ
ncbi:hypothetical protein BDR06DRAFT_401368 [Suillus hirtellus]|nr:hypothetical protein BDR06DRAFT_401368 [Suillus hirtellus]